VLSSLCWVCRFSFLILYRDCFGASTFCLINAKMAEEKKSVDPELAGFYEAMDRSNVEKITDKILVGLSGDSSDSEDF
jgi:hypothetical protein